MLKGYLVFNGEKSLDHGVYVSGSGTYASPEKDYNKVSVPGRNGDLIIWNGRYKNITVQYPCSIIPNNNDLETTVQGIVDWLYKGEGYLRLEDTYHDDIYRAAMFVGPFNPKILYFTAGAFTLNFDCKPQKYLKQNSFATEADCRAAGYTTTEQINFYKIFEWTTASKTVDNPTSFEAKPEITVYGYGEFKFKDADNNETIVKINNYKTDHSDWDHIVIDCETMLCYNGSSNANAYVEIGNFPTLRAGTTTITRTNSTITKFKMNPRWWRI